MTREPIEAIIHALEAEGVPITRRAIRDRLGYGSDRDIQRFLTEIQRDRAQAAAAAPETATAVADEPPVPDTVAAITEAEGALAAAHAHLATLQRELAPALSQRLMLVSAQRQGLITRSDPSWQAFDAATQQIYAAGQAVEAAREAVKAAERAHLAWQRTEALESIRERPDVAALLMQIARLEAEQAATPDTFENWGKRTSLIHALGPLHHQLQTLITDFLSHEEAIHHE